MYKGVVIMNERFNIKAPFAKFAGLSGVDRKKAITEIFINNS